MTTDLLVICLVPADLIEQAATETDRKYREQVRSAFAAFKRYGSIVNIQALPVQRCSRCFRVGYRIRRHTIFGRIYGFRTVVSVRGGQRARSSGEREQPVLIH